MNWHFGAAVLVCLSAGVLVASAQDHTPQPDCWCLQVSGCGSGSGFCSGTLTICDVGYSSCESGGKAGPLVSTARKCYSASGFTTYPCGTTPPSGSPTGCSSGGVCCVASSWIQQSGSPGNMMAPTGGPCTVQN